MKRKNKTLTRNAHTEGTRLSEQNCQIHVISLLEHVLYKSAKGNKGHCCQRKIFRGGDGDSVSLWPELRSKKVESHLWRELPSFRATGAALPLTSQQPSPAIPRTLAFRNTSSFVSFHQEALRAAIHL